MKPIHVLPIKDKIQHKEEGQDCWCEPNVKEGGMLIVHNSADGREYKEREVADMTPTHKETEGGGVMYVPGSSPGYNPPRMVVSGV